MSMASILLAYLWGRWKDESKVQRGSRSAAEDTSNVVETMDTPAFLSLAKELPTEIWIEILEDLPSCSLAQVMLVSRSLSEMAEGVLYRLVSLKRNTSEVLKFRNSIASCPRRGTLVFDLSIFQINGIDSRVPIVLPALLATLPNLRALSLRSSAPHTLPCDGILDVRLPHLRSLAANLHIGAKSTSAFLDFLAAHEDLDELDLRFSHPPDKLPALEEQLACNARPFSSLRVLACSSRFLNSRRPVLPGLTHLYRMTYLASEVAHIAALLGPQLVSLRLRVQLLVGADRTEPRWSLADVAARFPRLRFLQVDSPYKERPYLDTSVVDWLRPRQAPRNPAHGGSEAAHAPVVRLTIVWAYYEDGFWSDAAWAGTYDRFLDDAALRCLREWRGYVERVVYEHSVKPYDMESLMLESRGDGGEERVVRVQDAGIGLDDYWKRV